MLLRHGGRHDLWHNPATGVTHPVPRHAELSEHLARRLLRELSAG